MIVDVVRELEAIAAECRAHARSGRGFAAPTSKWADQLDALALRLDGDELDDEIHEAQLPSEPSYNACCGLYGAHRQGCAKA